MPTGVTNVRNWLFTKQFHKKFVDETKIDITERQHRDVLEESNKEIAKVVLDGNDGFKMPKGLGVIAINAFKSTKVPIDWKSTIKFGKRIPHVNLHSFGKIIAVKWYRIDVRHLSFASIYKFKACRTLARTAVKLTKEGKKYHNWASLDFFNATKLERLMIKRSFKELEKERLQKTRKWE